MGLKQIAQNKSDSGVQLHCQHQHQTSVIKTTRCTAHSSSTLPLCQTFEMLSCQPMFCCAGSTQALFVLTKFHTSKFEFIFTNFAGDSPRLFTTIQTVFRAYDTSRMYRDLKLRGAVISDKELKLLPLEQTYSQVLHMNNLIGIAGIASGSTNMHLQQTLQNQHHKWLCMHSTALSCLADKCRIRIFAGERSVESVQRARQSWHILCDQRTPRLARQPSGGLQCQHPLHADCQCACERLQVRPSFGD